ncbi:Soluble lytic murein transglycosylase precursor [Liberibacter crescens BT-1]|uniref:Soluble lytic murein transglycosylase n=1 Tax=Liberibacter crescens (strain BT-1) TaxID=1215343 RepID=L0ESR3_LIBCB|nr:lytic transglycosylase domain-containing protein [Liberibacter crescens]AGA64539.1 Soluble lytic murein transglycosylase precursor [Liberibacter crescens BT-1]
MNIKIKIFLIIGIMLITSFINEPSNAQDDSTKRFSQQSKILVIPLKNPKEESIPSKEISNVFPIDNPIKNDVSKQENIPEKDALRYGLEALEHNDIPKAILIRNRITKTLFDRKILTWAIVISGRTEVPSAEIIDAKKELIEWPYANKFWSFLERALFYEHSPENQVFHVFQEHSPVTPEGAILLAKIFLKQKSPEHAKHLIRLIWRTRIFDTSIEDNILQNFSSLLTAADHKARMDYLLFHNKINQAQRFAKMGKAQSLYDAWKAVNSRSKTVVALLHKADKQWHHDPDYLLIQIKNFRLQEKYNDAAYLLGKRPRDPEKLINPEFWWTEQRIISRALRIKGEFQAAYNLVMDYAATDNKSIVDAEFNAGWYALQTLHQPVIATKHFNNIMKISNSPLSISRAFYWLGRASELKDKKQAILYYKQASSYSTTFYGQLAAMKIGLHQIIVTKKTPTPADYDHLLLNPIFQAILRLEAINCYKQADDLYNFLAEKLVKPEEIAILANLAEKNHRQKLLLQIGKIAYRRGMNMTAIAFPLGIIPEKIQISKNEKALVYAISRQESEFDPQAISSAGAQGLMQLLPSTAKKEANSLKLEWNKDRLLNDTGYNISLGLSYIKRQINHFNGSYILAIAAYNSGPENTSRWIVQYGNPSHLPLDKVIDWIEQIPFSETRNYVQRVMENYEVYKSQFGEPVNIEQDIMHSFSP